MENPKTTLPAIAGWIGTAALIFGALGSACGQGKICGYFSFGGLVLHQVSANLGNMFSQDGKL